MSKRGMRFLTAVSAVLTLSAFAGGIEKPINPWMIYMGGFGGYYTADFLLTSIYVNSAPRFEPFDYDTFQQGGLGGVQIGVQYHMQSPYFLGLVASGSSNANASNITLTSNDNLGVNSFTIRNHFRIGPIWDIAGVLGFDLTPRTHLYGKLGGAHNRMLQTINFFTLLTPINSITSNFHYNFWSWIFGVGFTYDLSRWVNVFAEYDFYSSSTKTLKSVTHIFSHLFPPSTLTDQFVQQVRPTSSSIRLGLNIKFLDAMESLQWTPLRAWRVYVGAFGGSAITDFQNRASYYSFSASPITDVFNSSYDSFQQGFSGGGQFGIQYHTASPYFLGINVSFTANGQRANVIQQGTQTSIALLPRVNFQYKLKHHTDMTAILGADITPYAHVYFKAGASNALLKAFVQLNTIFAAPVLFESNNTQQRTFWGWIFGLGLTRDVNKWLNIFAEYTISGYHRQSLTTLHGLIAPFFASTDLLTNQLRRIIESDVHVGFNLKFLDSFHRDIHRASNARWQLFIGGFSGYSSIDFWYQANFQLFSTLGILEEQARYNNDAFQRAASGGPQLGVQYHFKSPYFIGLSVSASFNSKAAHLTGGIGFIPAFDSVLTDRFKLNNNVDITAFVGTDITQTEHVYFKVGTSRARLSTRVKAQIGSVPTIQAQYREHLSTWGGTFGIGFAHDWSRVIGTFCEYDYYSYGTQKLNTLFNPLAPPNPEELLFHYQSIMLHGWELRWGINFKI
jgi:outer membrane immunogenic protein